MTKILTLTEPAIVETPPVSQKPPTAPTTAPSSRSPTPKRPAEEEDGAGPGLASKRSRPLEELVCLDGLSTVSQVEGSLTQVKRDLEVSSGMSICLIVILTLDVFIIRLLVCLYTVWH